MEKNHRLNNLFDNLIHSDMAQIEVHGHPIMAQVCDAATKVSLSTTVYQGSNYIPKSVRNCIEVGLPDIKSDIRTFLAVDESNFRIRLNYLGSLDKLNHQDFASLIEEFSWIAEEWRYVLDEHDRHDLIHIHAKS